MNKKRVMLLSCAIILLCSCIIAGMSYALFTDSITVNNHLQAGNLNVTLTRTNLEYSVLDENGELKVHTIEEDLDLTTSTANNVFGIDSTNIRIVPGSFFDADLEIKNAGNTAFNYSISIKLLGDSTNLAKQLKVTVRDENGDVIDTQMLGDLANGMSIDTGKMKVGDTAQKFNVCVEFVDNTSINNAAQNDSAVFDLVVIATQATNSSN